VLVLLVEAVVSLTAGLLVAAVAWRWPAAASPHIPVSTVATEVRRHPRLAALARTRLDPTTATGLALTVAGALVLAGGVAAGLLFIMVRQNIGFARFDISAVRWGSDHATQLSTSVLRDISLLGGTLGLIVGAVVIAAVEHHRLPHRAVVPFLLATLVGQNLLANGVKAVVGRARPDIDRLTGFSGSSFPSGHATAAAAAYAAYALLLGRGRSARVKAVLAGAATVVAVAVAQSRVFLGVHWLTDVLAGLSLGWAWFALCSIAVGGRLLTFGVPVQAAETAARREDDQTCESRELRAG
jgi:membrane-associated phospholipid phosphatase